MNSTSCHFVFFQPECCLVNLYVLELHVLCVSFKHNNNSNNNNFILSHVRFIFQYAYRNNNELIHNKRLIELSQRNIGKLHVLCCLECSYEYSYSCMPILFNAHKLHPRTQSEARRRHVLLVHLG